MSNDNPVMPDPTPATGDAVLPPAPPPPPAAPAKKPVERKKPDDSIAGVVDTVEAIIIALILALTFRAFVVEAFVIPTGSMAPTLLGAHFQVTCPKCGYSFAENADLKVQSTPDHKRVGSAGDHSELGNSTVVPAHQHRTCPNCGFDIVGDMLPDLLVASRLAPSDVALDGYIKPAYISDGLQKVYFPWANNGDRILVMKYLYSISSPSRWDVIVFKEPMRARDNYIKRLIGLPGETIEVLEGDIFVGTGEAGARDPAARKIARKPRHVQDAVWQLVYDNNYYPIDEGLARARVVAEASDGFRTQPAPGFANPWVEWGKNRGVWQITGPIVRCDSNAGGTLHFSTGAPGERVFNESDNVTPRPPDFYARNVLGYNNDSSAISRPTAWTQRYTVGDLHLETTWTTKTDDASITLTLGKPGNCYAVTLTSGRATLARVTLGQPEAVTTMNPNTPPAVRAGKPLKVVMNNVDHRVELLVDGVVVLEHETPWTAADARNATDANTAPLVEISVSSAGTLSHLKLMRDLYYTPAADRGKPLTASDGVPLTLSEDEFFALGDNSTQSHDGRTWDMVYPAADDLGLRYGVVPRRYLLGKAFFVYWPAGHRFMRTSPKVFDGGLQRVIDLTASPLVPNTGEMRLIR